MGSMWKVGQKIKTPKGLGKIVAVKEDGTATYSLYKNSKGELQQGFQGTLPAYHIFQGDPVGFNVDIVEADADADTVKVEDYLNQAAEETYETPECMFCGATSILTLESNSLKAYRNGTYVQDAFPHESADVREMIKTGIHPKCWDDNLGDE